MTRSGRGADLFEVLGRRVRQPRESGRAGSRGRRASPDEGTSSWDAVRGDAQRLWQAVRGAVGGVASSRPTNPRSAKRADPVAARLPAGVLAAAVAVGLAVGFAVGIPIGRSFASAPGAQQALRRQVGPEIRTPGPMPQLSIEKELEVLSPTGMLLLDYAARDEGRACRLTSWLRDRGFPTVRLTEVPAGTHYIVVVYLPDRQAARTTAERLLLLDDPTFEPRWATEVRPRLGRPTDQLEIHDFSRRG